MLLLLLLGLALEIETVRNILVARKPTLSGDEKCVTESVYSETLDSVRALTAYEGYTTDGRGKRG